MVIFLTLRHWFRLLMIVNLELVWPTDATIGSVTWRRIIIVVPSLTANTVYEAPVSRETKCAGWAKSTSSSLYCFGQGRCIVGLSVNPNNVKGTQTAGYLCKVDPDKICEQDIFVATGEYGSLYSHSGYDGVSEYTNSLNCEYLITGPTDRQMRIRIQAFVTEGIYDKLKIYDSSDKSGSLLADLDGDLNSALPMAYQSTGNKIFLTFITDGSSVRTGFSLLYDLA